MSDSDAEVLAEISRLFVNMGAPHQQAEVMAAQLMKRAAQIAAEREISVLEATAVLLKQVVQARQGAPSGTDTGFDS